MIEKEDIKHVASLAKLAFNEADLAKFTSQMDQIMTMANSLAVIDTTDVQPTMSVVDETNVFREDKPKQLQTRAELLKNVPETENGLIKVPTIIDKEED